MGQGVVRVLCRVREKVGIRKLSAEALLVPLLAEAFGRMKMIYARDLRATNFSLHGQKRFLRKHFKFEVLCLLNLTVGKESFLHGPRLKFAPGNFQGKWHLLLGLTHLLLIMSLTCCFL